MSSTDLMSLCEENEVSKNANGGTERNKRRLYQGEIPYELLKEFQIVFSRVRELKEDKIRIFVANDLPGDPESEFLKNGGWNKFHKIVFISNWQMQQYIAYYNIPWSHCEVIKYAIDPIEFKPRSNTDGIRLIYTPTPHRGLSILYPVFNKLCEKYDDITLDVFSSFELYGWADRDKPFQELFENLKNHPKVNYHGTKPNEQVIEALQNSHIFAYPSIWAETFCLSLLEAMAAGCICVHPNYGCLNETAANWTMSYQYDEDVNRHASKFYSMLDKSINLVKSYNLDSTLKLQKGYVDLMYSWRERIEEWKNFLTQMLASNPQRGFQKQMFSYRVG